MDFAMLPPEVNSGRIYAGPGSGPMLAAAAAWDGLAAELQSTAASYGSVIAELTDGSWLGPSSASMVAATAPYLEWMTTSAAQANLAVTWASIALLCALGVLLIAILAVVRKRVLWWSDGEVTAKG